MNSKTHIKKTITHLLVSCLAIALLPGQTFAETGHEEETEQHEEGHIELTQEQIQHAGIGLTTVTSGTIRDVLPVYGVVVTNAERVQRVTARFDGIVREITHHFLMQLPRKRLVVAHDQGWNIQVLDDVGHGKGLAAARHTK